MTEESAARAGAGEPGTTSRHVHAGQRIEAETDMGLLRRSIRRMRRGFHRFQAQARRTRAGAIALRIGVTLVGMLVIIAGIIMLIGPGQGILAIILGLAILSTEYHWAERWMHRMRERMEAAARHAREMDPAVRRRRLLLTALAVFAVLGLVTWYVLSFGWPGWALSSWGTARDWFPFLPPLPKP